LIFFFEFRLLRSTEQASQIRTLSVGLAKTKGPRCGCLYTRPESSSLQGLSRVMCALVETRHALSLLKKRTEGDRKHNATEKPKITIRKANF